MKRTRTSTAGHGFTALGYGRRLLLMACIFVLMMALAGSAGTLAGGIYKAGGREYLIAVNLLQNLIGFCGTALVTALFVSTRPFAMLGMNRAGSYRALVGLLLAFALGIPFLNQVTWWNTQIHLPEAMQAFEALLRRWEDAALQATGVMLDTTSVGGLIVNILVIGIFTGLSEELCFRGCMQRVIASGGINGHVAVWLTAVIFSVLHFQFFGFLPRVLLGAFFGYLFLWTGSIYISAAAHALNNSLYVLLHWLTLRGVAVSHTDRWGVAEHGFPAEACVSLALVLVVLVGLRSYLFGAKKV